MAEETDQASASQAARRASGGSVPMIDAFIVKLACRMLEAAGDDPAAMLAACDLPADLLREPDSRIPFRQNVAFLEAAARQLGNPCFGLHLAAELNSQNVGVLGYVATASATVADALANVQRYYHVLSNGEVFDSHLESGQLVVEYRVLDVAAQHSRQNDDLSLMSIMRLMQITTGKRVFADWVELKHSEPSKTVEYSRLFGGALRFGADRNALAFPSTILDVPIHSADDNLLTILKGHCQSLLKERGGEDDLIRQVEEMALRLLPGGPPKAEAVARALGMSPRPLARRLQAHDNSYRDLLDELRANLARRYLRDQKLRLSDIAYMLGYADLSAFNHTPSTAGPASLPRSSARSRPSRQGLGRRRFHAQQTAVGAVGQHIEKTVGA